MLFVDSDFNLEFYGPVNTLKLTCMHFLGRLSPLSGIPVFCAHTPRHSKKKIEHDILCCTIIFVNIWVQVSPENVVNCHNFPPW